jgi:hypothetical protein
LLIDRGDGSSLLADDLLEVTVLSQLLVQVLLCLEGIFLVPAVDVVNLLDCALVASSHADLLEFSALLSLLLFCVEFLKFLPEFVGLLLLRLPMLSLVIFILSIRIVQVLLVVLSHLCLLGLDVFFVLGYLFSRSVELLLEGSSAHHVFCFLLAVEFQLVLGMFDGKINVFLMVCMLCRVPWAYCLTTMDLEMFLGRT